MANVIDIVIRANDQATRQIVQTQQAVDGLGRGLSNFASVAAAATVAAAAIGTAFTLAYGGARDLTDQLDDLQRRAGRTGLPIESVQALDRTLKNAGVSAEAGTQALTFLSRAIATQDPVLKALGITTRDTGTAFAQLLRILSALEDTGLRNEIAFRLMGRSSADVAAISQEIIDKLPEMRAQMIASGAAITDAMTPAIKQADERLEMFDLRIAAVTNRLKLLAVEVMNQMARAAEADRGIHGGALNARGSAYAGQLIGPPEPAGLGAQTPTASALSEINALLDETAKRGAKAKASIEDVARSALFVEGKGVGDIERHKTKMIHQIGFLGMVKEIEKVDWRSPLTEFSQTAQALMEAAASAIGSGFERAFAGIIDGTLNLKGAVVTIVSSMVDAIIAQLGRIAAKGFVSFLGNLIAPGLGTLLSSGMRAGPVAGAGVPRGAAAARGGNTYIFNGFNVGSMYRETVRPGGAVRRANDRLVIGAAF